MIQGQVNEKKGHVEEALEYFMDSADWYKKAYEGRKHFDMVFTVMADHLL